MKEKNSAYELDICSYELSVLKLSLGEHEGWFDLMSAIEASHDSSEVPSEAYLVCGTDKEKITLGRVIYTPEWSDLCDGESKANLAFYAFTKDSLPRLVEYFGFHSHKEWELYEVWEVDGNEKLIPLGEDHFPLSTWTKKGIRVL